MVIGFSYNEWRYMAPIRKNVIVSVTKTLTAYLNLNDIVVKEQQVIDLLTSYFINIIFFS